MKNNKLIAALACRSVSQRLYAKPLQNLSNNISILDHIIINLKKYSKSIQHICLAISNGISNYAYIEVAKKHEIPFIFGDEKDVLKRLIMCGELLSATDIFRITTECPFIALEYFDDIYKRHCEHKNDVTVLDGVPHGTHFEIYSLDALKRSHKNGTKAEKSEYCSLHIRRNTDKFKVEVVKPESFLIRSDIRLTIDYPEDLILCRKIYSAYLRQELVSLSLKEIVSYIDKNSFLKKLNSVYCKHSFFWCEENENSINL